MVRRGARPPCQRHGVDLLPRLRPPPLTSRNSREHLNKVCTTSRTLGERDPRMSVVLIGSKPLKLKVGGSFMGAFGGLSNRLDGGHGPEKGYGSEGASLGHP